jgi:hypothetical protein
VSHHFIHVLTLQSVMVLQESTSVGIQWSNINEQVSASTALVTIVMLAGNQPLNDSIVTIQSVDIVLYILIALYLGRVIPGEHGVPDPWYFPLLPLMRRLGGKGYQFTKDEIVPMQVQEQDGPPESYEPVSADLRARGKAISTSSLRKGLKD